MSKSRFFEIENASHRLGELLTSDASLREKRQAFLSFFSWIADQPQPSTFRSYFVQFASWLPVLSNDLANTFWPPARHEKFLEIIGLFIALGQSSAVHDLQADRLNAVLAACLSYFYVGEWQRALQLLGWPSSLSAPAPTLTLCRQAESLIEEGIKHGYPHTQELLPLVRRWQKDSVFFAADKVKLLLVESYFQPTDQNGGVLSDLFLRVQSRVGDAETDRILLNNELDVDDRSAYHALVDSVQVARDHMLEDKKSDYFVLHFALAEKEAELAGNSLSLGACLLAFAAIFNHYYRAPLVGISQSAALIGSMRPDGVLTAVDEQGLQAKIIAAFFSPLSAIYLPVENAASAFHIVQTLQADHPHRMLQVFALEHVRQALADRNLIKQEKIGVAIKTLAAIKRRRPKRFLAIGLFVGTLLFCLGIFDPLHWQMDQNPARMAIQQNNLVAYNAKNEELWKYDMGVVLTPANYLPLYFSNIQCSDLNQDGKNEILIAINEPNQPECNGFIYCFSFKGKQLWRYKTGAPICYGGERLEDNYSVVQLEVKRLCTGNKSIVALSRHCFYFPAVLTVLNSEGELQGEYWHAGHLLAMGFLDMEGDGVTEIFAGGSNNENGQAVLAVFDPRNVSGCSAQDSTGHYFTSDVPAGSEKYYLRFPPSLFCQKNIRDYVYSISVFRKNIKIEVANVSMITQKVALNPQMYCYILNRKLTIENIVVDDAYANYFQQACNKDITTVGLPILRQIQFGDGKKWHEEPTMRNN